MGIACCVTHLYCISFMNNLKGQASAEQIAEWKEKYDKVFQYTIEDKTCYLRPVDRNTYSAAAAKATSSPAKFNDTIINNIWLGGDEDIKKQDSYYYGLIDFIEDLMAKKKGSLTEV